MPAQEPVGALFARALAAKDFGRFLIEQQAYMSTRDGRIGSMRIMCSGFRPLD